VLPSTDILTLTPNSNPNVIVFQVCDCVLSNTLLARHYVSGFVE
jgi:hypothetical protein